MANQKNGFDTIFESTAGKKTKKSAPVKKVEKKPAASPAPKTVEAPVANGSIECAPADILKTAWKTHENEILYRKSKEDRVLVFSTSVLVALVLGAALVLGQALEWHWISRFIFRLFFCGAAFGAALAGNALVELNRRRMQDLLAMTIKIQESLGLYEEGRIPGADGAYFPNTYKFVGSMNDDETNYTQMILKVAGAAAIFVILLLA
ncbi:MAG TPA: hypothetical protein PK961_05835 [bacterium]|nr:hypothetical protein [bacterium]